MTFYVSPSCSIWKILHFYSPFSLNPSKSAFFHALTLSLPTTCLLFLNCTHAQDGRGSVGRWNELKEVLRIQTHAEVAKILLDR
jgi:hypothetical protein